jgi:hypothetical protein
MLTAVIENAGLFIQIWTDVTKIGKVVANGYYQVHQLVLYDINCLIDSPTFCLVSVKPNLVGLRACGVAGSNCTLALQFVIVGIIEAVHPLI